MLKTDQITLLSELNQAQIDQAFAVLVESFYSTFKAITKDKALLQAFFSDIFDHSMTYALLKGERVVGFLSLGNCRERSVKPTKEIGQKHFGKVKGAAVAWAFGLQNIMFVHSEDEASIDYLATDPACRGQGVASGMIEYLCKTLPYRAYLLETQTINATARRLYEKTGFKLVDVKVHSWYIPFFSRLFGQGAPLLYRLDLS